MCNVYANNFIKTAIILLMLEIVSSSHLKDLPNLIKPYLNNRQNPLKRLHHDKYLIIMENLNEDNQEIAKLYYVNGGDAEFYADLNEIQRRFTHAKEAYEEIKKSKLIKSQQDRKIKEINDFMTDRYLTTNYLYEEVQRIKRQRMVKDDLRKMVEYLEKPEKKQIKAQIMKCYREARKAEKLPVDDWRHGTNNLVVNVLKDPHNFGYIN